jgi:tetraacyldisaccharide 4'-kinase
VGDEPLLLARAAPTIVARDRPAGALMALREGASLIVMDDGLQNPSLARDLSLMLVDAATGIGNGLCLPAGPLRAPLSAHWPRVDALLLVGEGEAGESIAAEAQRHARPVLRVALVPDPMAAAALAGRRVLAFAGIGRPEKFFRTLRDCGAEVVEARAFADHHPFARSEVEALARDAASAGLVPVTTEKDMARLGALALVFGDDGPAVLPVTAQVEDEAALDALLTAALARARSARLSPAASV